MNNHGLRYQALDGLRAVAILCVLIAHGAYIPGMPAYPGWWWHLGNLGNLGVRIFFVISGFIITHLLLREYERTNQISLRNFYIRRAFRILPPLAALMTMVALGMIVGLWKVPIPQFILALVFLGNWSVSGWSWTIGHLWSLAVEEQFYLIWPPIIAYTFRKQRVRLLFLALSIVCAPIARIFSPASSYFHTYSFITNSDALAMGALAAIWKSNMTFSQIRKLLEAIPSIIYCMAVVFLNYQPLPELLKATFCFPLIHLSIAGLILRLSQVESDLGTRILSAPLFVFIGRISYSLYLFQQPVFSRDYFPAISHFPWVIFLAFALALLSYKYIELPSMKWRTKFLHPVSPSSSTKR